MSWVLCSWSYLKNSWSPCGALAGLVLRRGRQIQPLQVLPAYIVLWVVTRYLAILNVSIYLPHISENNHWQVLWCLQQRYFPPVKRKANLVIYYILCLVSHEVLCIIQPEIARVNSAKCKIESQRNQSRKRCCVGTDIKVKMKGI